MGKWHPPGYYNCRDRMCGALDCETCYGPSALRFRRQMAHEEHEHPEMEMDDCPECNREPEFEEEWERRIRRKNHLDDTDADYVYDPPMLRDPLF